MCPAGFYCLGGHHAAVRCRGDEGTYCPAGFTPGASSVSEGAAGKRCPPGFYCDGGDAAPVQLPQICDMAQSCGGPTASNESCHARQSTNHRLNHPPASHALDSSTGTCMKTASAIQDPKPQWLRVDLQRQRVVGTVRFWSQGAASDFAVFVAGEDAPWVRDQDGNVDPDPSFGGAIPSTANICEVNATGVGVFEARCPLGTIGQFVFIARSTAHSVLEVCEVLIFDHVCLPPPSSEQPLSCPMGSQSSTCAEDLCPGCVPCPAGTYSNTENDQPCTPCPGPNVRYGERPYSPAGSTALFQCQGPAHFESTSTLSVLSVVFNEIINSWEILISYSLGLPIRLNGLAALFLPKGGSHPNNAAFDTRNFPCRLSPTRSGGSFTSLEETACCLAAFRDEYVTTQTFREYTETLDLVAANDICDADDGSKILLGTDLDVVPSTATVFVDANGNAFEESIRAEPVNGSLGDMRFAKITIPDAELYKVSRHSGPAVPEEGAGSYLADSREMFVGLLDMLPTGTRVVDSSSQRITLELTRTQYGSFSAFGAQNINYDFISFLNARLHKVVDRPDILNPGGGRRGSGSAGAAVYFAEVSFVYDARLKPVTSERPVVVSSVKVSSPAMAEHNPCLSLPTGFLPVALQSCGPVGMGWGDEGDSSRCPQESIQQSNFGRMYIPLNLTDEGAVDISFDIFLVDAAGLNASLTVNLALAAAGAVTWCENGEAAVDLASRVIPSLLIGTERQSLPRVFESIDDNFQAWPSPAETLQDGLVTLVLELNETNELDANLEVFLEDVVVVHVNPGSQPDAETILGGVQAESPDYLPTFTYDPRTRDASIVIPQKLKDACPAEDETTSFFGCVHKHVVADKAVAKARDAFLLGSDGTLSEQDFMETMLGRGTAAASSRALGRAYAQYLVDEKELSTSNPGKTGLWINPGHRWGGIAGNSQYSLSQYLIVYVLYGVRAGVGSTRRALLQAASGEVSNGRLAAIKYDVDAASVVEGLLPDTTATFWTVTMLLDPAEACLPDPTLREIMGQRLKQAVTPYSSTIQAVQVVSLRTKNAGCDTPRRSSDSEPTAVMEVVIALDKSSNTFINWDAVRGAGTGVLAAEPMDSEAFEPQEQQLPVSPPASSASGGLGDETVAAVIALTAAVVALLVAVAVWFTRRRHSRGGRPHRHSHGDWEELRVKELPRHTPALADVETILFGHPAQQARASAYDELSHSASSVDKSMKSQKELLSEDLSVMDLIANRSHSLHRGGSTFHTASSSLVDRSMESQRELLSDLSVTDLAADHSRSLHRGGSTFQTVSSFLEIERPVSASVGSSEGQGRVLDVFI